MVRIHACSDLPSYPDVHLSIYQRPPHLPTYPSDHLSAIRPSSHLLTAPSIIYQSIHVSTHLSTYLSIHLFIHVCCLSSSCLAESGSRWEALTWAGVTHPGFRAAHCGSNPTAVSFLVGISAWCSLTRRERDSVFLAYGVVARRSTAAGCGKVFPLVSQVAPGNASA